MSVVTIAIMNAMTTMVEVMMDSYEEIFGDRTHLLNTFCPETFTVSRVNLVDSRYKKNPMAVTQREIKC